MNIWTIYDLFQLEERAEKAANAVEVANSDLKAELDRWHKYKRIDMKELFTELADSKIRFHEEVRQRSCPFKTLITPHLVSRSAEDND